MSRQRTINDGFWRSNRMSGRTVEDRFALFYFLTSPFSNIIGAYEVVIPIAASEMGWDTDAQLQPVIRRLVDAGYIQFDVESQFIWVRDWWEHNSAKMAVSSKLRQKAFDQIGALPKTWRNRYVEDLIDRLPAQDPLRSIVATELGYLTDMVSIPHPYPSDGLSQGSAETPQAVEQKGFSGNPDRVSIPHVCPSHRSHPNTTTNSNSISTTTDGFVHSLHLPSELAVAEQTAVHNLLASLPSQDAQMLVDELAATLKRPGAIKTSSIQYLRGLLQRKRNGNFTPAGGIAIAAQRERQQREQAEYRPALPPAHPEDSRAYLAVLKEQMQQHTQRG